MRKRKQGRQRTPRVAPKITRQELSNESKPGTSVQVERKAPRDNIRSSKSKSENLLPENNTTGTKREISNVDATTIYDLPEEILLTVFKYLGHGDLLTSRRVCNTWNNIISNFHHFPETKMIYSAKRGATEDILEDSAVPWRRLRLNHFNFHKGVQQSHFTLSPNLSSIVTSLELSNSRVTWNMIYQTLIQFQSLQELKIFAVKQARKMKGERLPDGYKEKFMKSVKNLKSITLEDETMSEMTFFIDQFNLLNVSKLVNITLVEIYSCFIGKNEETDNAKNAEALISVVSTLVQKSSTTLKSLNIHFKSLHVVDSLFPEVIEKLIGQVDLNFFNIGSFSINDPNKMERDMDIFTRFIKSQKNLKEEMYLPKTKNAKAGSWTKLLQAVNKDIKKLHIPSSRYVKDDFLDHFSKLRELSYDFKLQRVLNSSKEESYPKMHTLKVEDHCDVKLISLKFPNLTKLTLAFDRTREHSNQYTFHDSDLQAIIQSLKKLKCLNLGNCRDISDFGVSGINNLYCQEVWRSKWNSKTDSYSKEDIVRPVPQDKIEGSPISSLTGLTHLTLARWIGITEIGLYYGFRFKELRYLNMVDCRPWNMRVTGWGLEWLAKFNPDLDYAYFNFGHGFRCPKPEDYETIKPHLRRIKKHNIDFQVNQPLR